MTTATLYSADEVADMLGLHVRTVRNYMRDGRLPAVKIGKQYRVAAKDVDKLTGGRTAASADPVRSSGRLHVDVTTVVHIDGIDPEAMARLTALVAGAASTRPGDDPRLHVETVYDPKRRSVKIVAVGSAANTATLVSLIDTFAEAA